MRDYIFKIKHVYRVCILTLLQQSPEKRNFVYDICHHKTQ